MALAMRLVDDGAQLGRGEGRNVGQHAACLDAVAAIRIHLDPVDAVRQLLAHRAAHAVDAVGVLHALRHRHARRIAERPVGAGDIERAAGDQHVRAGDHAAVDGIAHVDVGVARALGLDVADGREAPLERTPRVDRGEDRPVFGRLPEELLVVVLGGDVTLQQHVGMGIDEPRQAGQPSEVDDRGTGRRHGAGRVQGDDLAGPDLDHPRRAEAALESRPDRAAAQPLRREGVGRRHRSGTE